MKTLLLETCIFITLPKPLGGRSDLVEMQLQASSISLFYIRQTDLFLLFSSSFHSKMIFTVIGGAIIGAGAFTLGIPAVIAGLGFEAAVLVLLALGAVFWLVLALLEPSLEVYLLVCSNGLSQLFSCVGLPSKKKSSALYQI
ncbi:hypothetical protein CDAR_559811 [Caerostris darwini]|uniref:Uncharacterized protein n=1 Tax=Caerostris darwini TaxID=1538125 RepID=A0AAV4T8U5_9ARAC|nr:hypothetical protein CDAR_559811 [Caerostris darwini]